MFGWGALGTGTSVGSCALLVHWQVGTVSVSERPVCCLTIRPQGTIVRARAVKSFNQLRLVLTKMNLYSLRRNLNTQHCLAHHSHMAAVGIAISYTFINFAYRPRQTAVANKFDEWSDTNVELSFDGRNFKGVVGPWGLNISSFCVWCQFRCRFIAIYWRDSYIQMNLQTLKYDPINFEYVTWL